MPKETKSSGTRGRTNTGTTNRHAPLGQQYATDENRSKYATVRSRSRSRGPARSKGGNRRGGTDGGDNSADTTLLDEKTSRKILELSKEQMVEVEMEEQKESSEKRRRRQRQMGGRENGMDSSDEEDDGGSSSNDDSDDEDDDDDGEEQLVEHGDGFVTVAPNEGLSAEEEAVVSAMMGENKQERRTLADIILEKIAEKEAQQRGESLPNGETPDDDDDCTEFPPRVIEVYTEIGNILSRYTAGKLPKAFKVIPSLANWESVLYLTRPDMWTPQAMYAATRIFASNLNPKMAQRFYSLVLLDAVRADICENHKLNYHYYISLKKAVYKPAAFFKGVLLPLCKDECTLREAAIVASVLQRVSIPVHHSAVAIHKLAQMEYSGAASIFIKTLLDKKYALPEPVIGSVVRHFAHFAEDREAVLPVLWHQALLVFVQRYKNEVNDEGKEALRVVMKHHSHHKLTPEIRRELFGSQAWKEEREASCLVAGVAMET